MVTVVMSAVYDTHLSRTAMENRFAEPVRLTEDGVCGSSEAVLDFDGVDGGSTGPLALSLRLQPSLSYIPIVRCKLLLDGFKARVNFVTCGVVNEFILNRSLHHHVPVPRVRDL